MKKWLLSLLIIVSFFFSINYVIAEEENIDESEDKTQVVVDSQNTNNDVISEEKNPQKDLSVDEPTGDPVTEEQKVEPEPEVNINSNEEEPVVTSEPPSEIIDDQGEEEVEQVTPTITNVEASDNVNNINVNDTNNEVETNEVKNDEVVDEPVMVRAATPEVHNYDYQLKSGEGISLSSIFTKLNITVDMSDVTGVEVTNSPATETTPATNITAVQNGNDWTITSESIFKTQEILTVTTSDGTKHVIRLTDSTIPSHGKEIVDNGDGTYTLELTITGESERVVNKVNVVVVIDTSGSMDTSTGTSEVTYEESNNGNYGIVNGEYIQLYRYGNSYYYFTGTNYYDFQWVEYTDTRYTRHISNPDRLEAAQAAVNSLAQALLSNNGVNNNPNDTVEMALVEFNTNANVVISKTTSYDEFSTAVNGLNHNGGTNWEAALAAANGIDFEDSDQTYVIFVSDGNPTFRDSQNGYNDYNNRFGVYGTGQEGDTNVARSYEAATDDAKAIVDDGKKFYTIGAYGNVTRMSSLTTAAGAPAENYYSAANTTALNNALNAILAEIETAGFGTVQMVDGTTDKVATSTGVSHLLEVDKNSFKYYRSDIEGEWTTIPDDAKAEFNSNGEVVWNLSSLGILDNGVTYKVTFRVWPSQETLDLIADLRNNPSLYDTLDENIKKYLVESNGGYVLKTNTTATLSFTDTRPGGTENGNATYANPDPVNTTATEALAVTKEWIGKIDDNVELWVTRDGDAWYQVKLVTEDGKMTGHASIAVGIMTDPDEEHFNTNIEVLSPGHEYAFAELGDDAHHWEIRENNIVRPMLINGVLKSLMRVDEAPSGKYYVIDGKYYVIGDLSENEVTLTATNERRANVDLVKEVTGDYNPEGFGFEFTISAKSADSINPHDDYIWFTVWFGDEYAIDNDSIKAALGDDFTNGTVKADLEDGVERGTFYVANDTPFTILMQDGWKLRIKNLLTGSTYSFTESTDPRYILVGVNGKNVTSINGEVETIGENPVYTFVNKFVLKDITVTKVWDDDNDVNNNRPTSITLNLKGNDTTINQPTTYTKDEDGNWVYVYTNLDVFDKNGNKITYTLTEDKINGYTEGVVTGDSDNGFTVTNSTETTSVTVKKIWNDVSDQDRKRSGVVATVQLYQTVDGQESAVSGKSATVGATDNWTTTWGSLPTYYNMKAVTYTVRETLTTPNGYELTNTDTNENTTTFTNSYTPETIKIQLEKYWDDKNDQDGKRKDGATIVIYAGEGEDKKVVKTFSTAKSEKSEVYELPKYADGVEIVYSVEETVKPKGYDSKIDTSVNEETKVTLYKVTNSYTPETIKIQLEKYWDDKNDQDGKRKDGATIVIYAGEGEDKEVVKTFSTAKSEKSEVYELPKYADGEEIVYSVEETVKPKGYDSKIEASVDEETKVTLYKVTNSYTTETVDVTVTKVWNDNNDQDGIRPTELKVTLSNGTEVSLTAKDNWTATITGLDKYADGEEIEYTWTEGELPEGYTMTSNVTEGLETTITNTHETEQTEVSVRKVWDDKDNYDEIRPNNVTIILYANGDKVTSVELNESNGWAYTWTKLDKKEAGVDIEYSVEEKEIEGYVAEITGNMKDGFVITNTHYGEGGDVPPTDNPKTGDNIYSYIAMLLICLAGLVKFTYSYSKNN